MEKIPGSQVCISLLIDSSCRTQSEANKTRQQKCHFWTCVPDRLPVQPVIPSLAAVHLWIHTNIQQTSSTNLSLHSPYGHPEGDMLPTHFTYLKVTERILVACLCPPAQHCSLAYFYLYMDYPGIRSCQTLLFFFLLTLNKLRVSLI